MSDYTIVNLGDLENVAPKYGMEGLEARFAKRELGTSVIGLSEQKLVPGHRLPMGHRHARQEELYVVTAGSGRIKLDDDVRDLRAGDVVRIGAGVMRNLEAGPDGIAILAIGAPIFEESDAEMEKDWWSD